MLPRLAQSSLLPSLRRLQPGSFRLNSVSRLACLYSSNAFPPHSIISMPALSPTMTAGNIGAWHKSPGDTLAPGDVLVEIETDKAQMDFEFQDEGVLAKVLLPTGQKDVPVGTPIAVLMEEGGDVSAFDSFSVDKAPSEASKAKEESAPKENAPPAKESSAPQGIQSSSSGNRLQTSLERKPLASPSVRKLAADKGIDLSKVSGKGPGGRITEKDLKPTEVSAAAPASYTDAPASSMRKVIAARLTESKLKNPHYYISSSVSVSKILKLRKALNDQADGAYKLSINDFLVKALAVAARKVPAANSSWVEEGGEVVIRTHNVVDVSVAVATPSGLVTPIVHNVGGLGISEISKKIKDLGARARQNKLQPQEYQGGTITISNLGMNDAVDAFSAVINPPQATILAVGCVNKVALPAESEDGTTEVMWDDQIILTASFDHKVVDGITGADFMRELKRVLEHPLDFML